jgi:hypothetical protein
MITTIETFTGATAQESVGFDGGTGLVTTSFESGMKPMTINLNLNESPVKEVDGKININPAGMTQGAGYSVNHKGKTFVAVKTSTGSVRLYELRG